MEGVITVAISFYAAVMLVKFPDEELKKPSVRFLNPEQLSLLVARLNADRGDVELEPFTIKRFIAPATEWFIYGFPFILMYVSPLVPNP